MRVRAFAYAATLIAGIAFGTSSALAQWSEDATGMFETKKDYNQFMGSAKRASVDNPEMRAMIPLINDIALGNPIGSSAKRFGSSGSELGLLANPRVREDIEMVDDQYEDLQNRHAEIQKRLAQKLREFDFTDSENVVSQIRELRDEAQKDLNAVLLPHQVKRLQQIKMQALLRQRSLVQVLTSDPIKTDLQITNDQRSELREFEQEVQADLAKEIARLQEKARMRLLSKLEPSQKSQAEELIGDAFEFPLTNKNKKADKKKAGREKKEKRASDKLKRSE